MLLIRWPLDGGMNETSKSHQRLHTNHKRNLRGSVACASMLWAALTASAVQAEDLSEALQQAYVLSEQIANAKATHDADQAAVVISRADGLPTVGTSVELTEPIYGSNNNNGRINVQGQISVPLFQGGAVRNGVQAARLRSEASSVAIFSAEIDVFTAVVSAYANVIRDQRIVDLSRTNLESLTKMLTATRARHRARDLTRTDLAQAESRAALARGELETATARLSGSVEEFRRLTGITTTTLSPLPPLSDLPGNADIAVTIALDENPLLISARSRVASQRYDVKAARGEALPRLSAVVNGRYSDRQQSNAALTDTRFGATVGVSMNMSLFQGGRTSARVRQASARETQAQQDLQGLERTLTAKARSEYASWQAARAVVLASEQAVDGTRQALAGVKAESDVGSRTILDVLNAEQELRNAQVQLANAERDSYLASFSLLATMGRTQAQNLGVQKQNVAYEPRAEYTPPADVAPEVSTAPLPQQELEPLRDQASANSVIVPPEYAPVVASVPMPMPTPVQAPVQPPKPARETAAPRPPVAKANASSAIPSTHWVVQLAAHDSSNAARAHWGKIQKAVSKVVPSASPMVAAVTNSAKPVYRLAIGAFADFTAAETACQDLRVQDQNCMVRRFGTLGTVQWTDKTPQSGSGSK